jgi:hypothetical protein
MRDTVLKARRLLTESLSLFSWPPSIYENAHPDYKAHVEEVREFLAETRHLLGAFDGTAHQPERDNGDMERDS